MATHEGTGAAGPGRTWSLRHEWTRAFAIMLVLLLVASVATFAGVRQLVGQFSGTARALDRETTTIAALDAALVVHEAAAHQLLNGAPVDRTAFLDEQGAISAQFEAAVDIFQTGSDRVALLGQARVAWQVALTKAGLWGDQIRTFDALASTTQNRQVQVTLGADSDTARGFLAAMQGPTLAAMHAGLARDAALQREITIALGVVFAAALAATVYFRRRMLHDLLRPVAAMHAGVLLVRDGDYAHRIEVARRDELGELVEAYNAMAGAVHESHVALTLRATHDALTGLPNRTSLSERLAASAGRGGGEGEESVLFIDVDDFKLVNDSLGHEGGDALLIQVARRLEECVRPDDLVCRLGGDEFAVAVAESAAGSGAAVGVAERVLTSMHAPFFVAGHTIAVGVSIGIARTQPDTHDPAELVRRGDFAMYMAKSSGKGRYQLYNAGMYHDTMGRAALKSDLAVAVSSGQLRVAYQPVADIRTGEVVGVEALVRWQHPTLGLLPPGEFIALAEQTGDIDAIGCWVLETATREVARWRRTMEHCSELWVSVNLSAYQLPNVSSRSAIQRILADPASDAARVVLEVTETALAADIDGAIASLTELKVHGARIAIDDFGTGFSSLSALASLPVDILKIDRSFVSGPTSARSTPILEGILGLADKLGLDVIAEGIEAPEQLELLRSLHCRLGQGYLLARPSTGQAIERMLASGGLLPLQVIAP